MTAFSLADLEELIAARASASAEHSYTAKLLARGRSYCARKMGEEAVETVIAAVEGAAAGAGFSLALMCDFVVAASDSFFVMAYSNIALSPDGGGSWNLARSLPRPIANEILMLGERITAVRLHQLGWVNQLSNPGESLVQALHLAQRLNARAPNALTGIKDLLNSAGHMPLSDHLAQEKSSFVTLLHHPNALTGITALLNKQTPDYR
mgnify:CR=1 FL=1